MNDENSIQQTSKLTLLKTMIPLKPDGTLDIEKIDNLSSEQYLRVLESMTQEQYEYYSDHGPVNEGRNKPTKAIKVNYILEEVLEKGVLVDATQHLKKLRDMLRNEK